jgi:hypothetical protein
MPRVDVAPGSWRVQIQDIVMVKRVRVERGRSAQLGESIQVLVTAGADRRNAEKDSAAQSGQPKLDVDVERLKAIELVLI